MKRSLVPALAAPRNGRAYQVILVSRVSDPGPGKQDPRSNSDQQALLEQWARDHIDGQFAATVMAGSGSGEWLGREEYLKLIELVEAGQFDLVITEDLGRIVRRLQAHFFAELCVDHHTRLIALNDHVDTAEPGWQDRSIFSAWHHERSNRDTSDRIKRTHRNRFESGGCAAFPIYGIIKPEGAKSDADWYKDQAAEPIYAEWFSRLENGSLYSEVADWLNESRVPTGPYCRVDKWDGPLVGRVTHNPLLKGYRRRNVRKTVRNSDGKYISVKADVSELRLRHVPHLAFLEEEYYDRVIAMLVARNGKYRRTGENGRDTRANVSKKRTRFPGQTIYCGVCGRLYVFGGHGQKDHLMCEGARGHLCWNGITVDGPLACEVILNAVFTEVEALPDFDEDFIARVTREGRKVDQLRAKRLKEIHSEIARLDREIARLIQFIKRGIHSASVSAEMPRLESEKQALQWEQERLSRLPSDTLILPPIDELKHMARESLSSLAKDSFELSKLMGRLVGKIVVFPFRSCDGGHPVLRGRFRLRLGNLIGDLRVREALQRPLERVITVDLFKKPQREEHRERIIAMRNTTNPKTRKKFTEKEVAEQLRITSTAAQRAAVLQRRMNALGIDDPYLPLASPPDDYAKLSRHKHPRYKFEPLDDTGAF